MTIGRICQTEVDYAQVSESAQVAADRMRARNVGTLVVLDAGEALVGILTDRDVALRVVAEGLEPASVAVGDVMTTAPECVPEDMPIEEALRRMRADGIRRLPVIGDDGDLLGIVSLDDILLLLAEEFVEVGRLIQSSSPQSLAGR